MYDILYLETLKNCEQEKKHFLKSDGFKTEIDSDEIHGYRLIVEHETIKEGDYYKMVLKVGVATVSIGFRMWAQDNPKLFKQLVEEIKLEKLVG